MLDHQDATNVDAKGIPFTVRTVFVIDPKKVIRLTISYPASTGRNFDEILRVIDCKCRLVTLLEFRTNHHRRSSPNRRKEPHHHPCQLEEG
jgi:alkyl hydroperoxide reductase subunit AhpC